MVYQLTGQCIKSPIQNCLEVFDWRGQEFLCSKCADGFLPAEDQTYCIEDSCTTIKNCVTCSEGTCTKCRLGFSPSGSSCTKNACTKSNCLYCDPSGACLRCSSNYTLDSASGSCPSKANCSISNC